MSKWNVRSIETSSIHKLILLFATPLSTMHDKEEESLKKISGNINRKLQSSS